MNNELAFSVLEWVEDNPEHHNQNTWGRLPDGGQGVLLAREAASCGTVGCLAYWATVHAWPDATFRLHAEGGWVDNVRLPDRRCLPVNLAAQEALGLSGEQAEVLFLEARGVGDLRAVIEHLADSPHAGRADLAAALLRRRWQRPG